MRMPPLLPCGGGGLPSFSNIGASVRSVLGTRTLLSMQQFIENVEMECGDEDSELDAKHALDAKSARQDSVKALRKLFEDFEAQLNLQ